ncbi:MAG: hypothetical protein OEM21_10420 [Nitrosopumilus sp.]|nr:hypothetical protein [Nitrosopumilus sp.]
MTFKNLLLLSGVLSLVFAGLTSPAFADGNGMAEAAEVAVYVDSSVVSSVDVSANGKWFEFSFNQTDLDVRGCPPNDPDGFISCQPSVGTPTQFAPPPPWTFDCPSEGCWLTVTDAFLYGDVFEIFDNSISIGTTSSVDIDDQSSCGSDPEVCLNDPLTSSGMFDLGPGAHSITMRPTTVVLEGAAYFKLESHEVPVAGQLVPTNFSSLVIAGLTGNAIWLIPVISGLAGVGLYMLKLNKK